MCEELVAGGLDGLCRHFVCHHGLTVNRGIRDSGFVCAQNGCPLKTLQSAQQSASTSIIDKEPPHVFSVGYNDKIQNIPCSHFLIIQFIT